MCHYNMCAHSITDAESMCQFSWHGALLADVSLELSSLPSVLPVFSCSCNYAQSQCRHDHMRSEGYVYWRAYTSFERCSGPTTGPHFLSHKMFTLRTHRASVCLDAVLEHAFRMASGCSMSVIIHMTSCQESKFIGSKHMPHNMANATLPSCCMHGLRNSARPLIKSHVMIPAQ